MSRTLPLSGRIGRAGLTPEATANVDRLLAQHELIKLGMPAGCKRKELAQKLAEDSGAFLVAVIGRSATLYRPNPALPRERRVSPD
jgi:RNA-binding protein YhbY